MAVSLEQTREAGRKRHAGKTPEQRSAEASALARQRWSHLTPEERKVEMRRNKKRYAAQADSAGQAVDSKMPSKNVASNSTTEAGV